MDLDTRWLTLDTRRVFEVLRNRNELSDFTLIGGSALALQIGHRLSQDLDFYFSGNVLPSRQIRNLLSAVRDAGFTTQDMLSPAQIQQTRINHATDLHEWIQDWAIGGVKVSFSTFEGFHEQMRVTAAFPKVANTNTSFPVLGIEGIFAMKSALLARRVRSRDLYDIKVLLERHGYSIRQLFASIKSVDPGANPDLHRDVLRGIISLDANDEGFAAINVATRIEDLYAFFRPLVDDYEREEARRIIDEVRQRPK